MLIHHNIPLAPHTTLGVGGPARYFTIATTAEDARRAIHWSCERNLPLFVLGGGSNLVVADSGFPGLVMKVALRGIESRIERKRELFSVGAGEHWDFFVAHAVARDCAGVECLSGIPGLTGATPVQNVGAYGQEVSQTIRSVEALEPATGEIECFDNAGCAFGYRKSIFNGVAQGRFIILRVHFALKRGGKPSVHYADLQAHFAGHVPTLAATREAVRQIRRRKGMLLVEGDPGSRSAGSFFKNPVLGRKQFMELEQRAAARGLTVPAYPGLAKQRKVAAAWLVEQAGIHKGYVLGRVGISRRHALALVNLGGATAAEVIALKNQIQRAVHDQFGIELQPEPVFVGFEEDPALPRN